MSLTDTVSKKHHLDGLDKGVLELEELLTFLVEFTNVYPHTTVALVILCGSETIPSNRLVVLFTASWDFDPLPRTQASALFNLAARHLHCSSHHDIGPTVIVIRPQRPSIDHLHIFVNSVDSSSTEDALTTIKLFTHLGYSVVTTVCDDIAAHTAHTGYTVRSLFDLPPDCR